MIFWEPERPEITTLSIYIILGSYLQWRFLKPSVTLYHSLWWGKLCQQFLSSHGQHKAHGSHSHNAWYSISLISYWIYRCTWSRYICLVPSTKALAYNIQAYSLKVLFTFFFPLPIFSNFWSLTVDRSSIFMVVILFQEILSPGLL